MLLYGSLPTREILCSRLQELTHDLEVESGCVVDDLNPYRNGLAA